MLFILEQLEEKNIHPLWRNSFSKHNSKIPIDKIPGNELEVKKNHRHKKESIISDINKNVEHLEISCEAGWNLAMVQLLWKTAWPLVMKFPVLSGNSTLRNLPMRKEIICPTERLGLECSLQLYS